MLTEERALGICEMFNAKVEWTAPLHKPRVVRVALRYNGGEYLGEGETIVEAVDEARRKLAAARGWEIKS